MIIKEYISFERGKDPKQSMDIGLFAKINKITSSDLEFLKVYTNGEGKGHIDEDYFIEMYESSASLKEYLKRAEEVYKLLEPYEYLFGDMFGEDMKKEMKEYINSYLKNPKYNYAYNCDIMEEGDFDVFFCQIELPSAELLGKKKALKESMNFERGLDPKASIKIGIKAKVKEGMACLLRDSRNSSNRISTINLEGNRNDLWLAISDYGTPNFEDLIDRCFGNGDYFEQIYVKAKPRKYKNSWKNDWVLIIKTQYKSAFRACFDGQGYLTVLDEAQRFERGIDPMDKMSIGRVEERKQKLIDEITSDDPSKWMGSSVLAHLIRKRFPFVWDREMFKEESLEDLQYYLGYIQKWNKIDKRFKVFDGPASTVQEALDFERGKDPYKAMKIGTIRPVDQLKKDYDQIVELVQREGIQFQKEFSEEALDLIEDRNQFGWGSIHWNFKNMSREELYPFEQLVQKYTAKLFGLDES